MYASQRRDLCIPQISLLLNFTDIHVRSEITRREHKLTTGTVKMYLLVHFYLRVCCANTLLCSNTAILGGSDTLRIFSSGTDAAGLNRSDISALPKFAMKSVHGRTLFMMRRRCAAFPALLKIVVPDTRRRANNTRRRAFCTSRTVIRSATP